MASTTRPSQWDELPDEIMLQILSLLEPYHITRLQLVSRKLQKICLDDELWKRLCFENSMWYQALKRRRSYLTPPAESDIELDDQEDIDWTELESESRAHKDQAQKLGGRRWRELQDMANWDPAFPRETTSWYDEYIQRHGPTCVNWMQTARLRDRGVQAINEARGVALYSPYEGNDGLGTMLAVSPLDDGSVCLWDVKGSRGPQGSILAQSKPDILFIDGPSSRNTSRSKRIDTGVTECVSVNNDGHRAFFAVQSHLIEVDLHRLEVVSRESFEWSITTLSPVHHGVPLTVGTSLGIHLHDFRARATPTRDVVERVDSPPQWDQNDVLRAIFDPKPLPPYASLSQPTPISILHLPQAGSPDLVSDDIYVSGRFSNILHYDRRKFPAIVSSIYSGALVKSLAALPFPYSTVDAEVRRNGELSVTQAAELKEFGEGRTLIAGGGYKSKGSLEMYGLSAAKTREGPTLQNSVFKNRQTAASSTILSVINHGTKIVFSDGSGFLKWFERDGSTECRRMRIGHSDGDDSSSIFRSMPASDDMARKILSTRSANGNDRPNNDNILLWTGEKLGMVSFTTAPLFDGASFEEEALEPSGEDIKRLEYTQRMRSALERQADEVRFMSRLGMPTTT